MKIEQAMVTDVATIAPDGTVVDAARIMVERGVGCLVVTLEQTVKGIVTDRDVLYCLTGGHDPHQCRVSAHMSRPVVTQQADEDVLIAAQVMAARGIKRLPILRERRLVGILSLSDLARVTHRLAEELAPSWAAVTSLIASQGRHRSGKGERRRVRAAAALGAAPPAASWAERRDEEDLPWRPGGEDAGN